MKQDDTLYTPDIARVIGRSESTVYDRVNQGKLPRPNKGPGGLLTWPSDDFWLWYARQHSADTKTRIARRRRPTH